MQLSGNYKDSPYFVTNLPSGKGDKYLREVARDVQRVITRFKQNAFVDSLQLHRDDVAYISKILADFAEDLHNDIGIWRVYEDYNRKLFGVALPVTEGEEADQGVITADRIRHLLWVNLMIMDPDLILSPSNALLSELAEIIAETLAKRIAPVPRDSGMKKLMNQPNQYGWEVKKKLLRLVDKSYFLRTDYRKFLDDHMFDDVDLEMIEFLDAFVICEHTSWSGMTALEILAGVLTLTEQQRMDLLLWGVCRESVYRIGTRKGGPYTVTNLFNGRQYPIMTNEVEIFFEEGDTILGKLIPWNSYWYWCGVQSRIPAKIGATIAKSAEFRAMYALRDELLNVGSAEALVRTNDANKKEFQNFTEYYGGKSVVIFPDGASLVASERKRLARKRNLNPLRFIKGIISKDNSDSNISDLQLPDDLLQCTTRVALYFDLRAGLLYSVGFDSIANIFAKQGHGLTDLEARRIFYLLQSAGQSALLIRHLVKEYGGASLCAALQFSGHWKSYTLDYLLRRYQGDKSSNVVPDE